MKAIWNGEVIAESDETIIVEGNHYFPRDAIRDDFFEQSNTNTNCAWKGTASYFNVAVGGQKNPDSAWYYPNPTDAANEIKDYIAFWRGIEVIE